MLPSALSGQGRPRGLQPCWPPGDKIQGLCSRFSGAVSNFIHGHVICRVDFPENSVTPLSPPKSRHRPPPTSTEGSPPCRILAPTAVQPILPVTQAP